MPSAVLSFTIDKSCDRLLGSTEKDNVDLVNVTREHAVMKGRGSTKGTENKIEKNSFLNVGGKSREERNQTWGFSLQLAVAGRLQVVSSTGGSS